jgi:hypothetical protein
MKTSNKHKYFLISAVAAATLLLAACELERLPYDEISADALDAGSIETITRGNYAKLKEEYYYKTLHQIGEYGGDNISLSGTTTDLLYNTYTYRRLTTNHYTARVWQFTYQTVVNINSTLETVREGESPEKDHLLGENYFLRGFLYFHLCNIFGRPYVQDPATNLGIPLKLTSNINDFPPRATVAKVYEQVVSDFKKAAELMSIDKPNIFASKEVAYAYLSRVYLYMEKWEEAKASADLVIDSKRYSLVEGAAYKTYAQAVPEANTETIFAIRMMKDTDFKEYHMDFYSVGALYAKIDNQGWGEMYPSTSYLDLLDRHESDLRHAFIVNEMEKGELLLSYAQNSDGTYLSATNKVKREGEDYVIVEHPEIYKSATVQKEVQDGRTRYYVERKDDNRKYYVRIETVSLRNGFPMRYIYKCSMQEEQSHLYSPVLIRLAEVYLNRAEANAELGNDAAAIEEINAIRRRAQIPERSLSDLKAGETVLDWVLEERRLELAWEGQRKYDVFRKRQTLDRRYPGTHLSGSPVYFTLEPAAPDIVEYIPQSEIDAYPTPLTQNP